MATVGMLPRTLQDPREAYRSSQRGRLLIAAADAAAEHGFGAMTVADVVARAGVSRRAFYEHFADRQAALLAAYDASIDVMTAELAGAVMVPDTPAREQLRLALDRFLELMADDPAAARLALVEVLAVGAPGRERFSAATVRFTALLGGLQQRARAEDSSVPEVGPIALEAVAGGINRVVTTRVLEGRADELPAVADELEAFAATVLFGAAA